MGRMVIRASAVAACWGSQIAAGGRPEDLPPPQGEAPRVRSNDFASQCGLSAAPVSRWLSRCHLARAKRSGGYPVGLALGFSDGRWFRPQAPFADFRDRRQCPPQIVSGRAEDRPRPAAGSAKDARRARDLLPRESRSPDRATLIPRGRFLGVRCISHLPKCMRAGLLAAGVLLTSINASSQEPGEVATPFVALEGSAELAQMCKLLEYNRQDTVVYMVAGERGARKEPPNVDIYERLDSRTKRTVRIDGEQAGKKYVRLILPDMDGDGVSDLVVGEPSYEAGGYPRGRVTVYSGSSFAELWSTVAPGDRAPSQFGVALALGPDVDGDGHAEILVGAPAYSESGKGAAFLLSASTGRIVETLEVSSTVGSFGASLLGEKVGLWACLSYGHVSLDQYAYCLDKAQLCTHIDELILFRHDAVKKQSVIALRRAFSASMGGVPSAAWVPALKSRVGIAVSRTSGEIEVIDAEDGGLIRSLNESRSDLGPIAVLWCRDDVTGDGIPDLIAGYPSASTASTFLPGRVQVWSATDHVQREWTGTQSLEQFGSWVSTCSDVDGDHVSEVVIGSAKWSSDLINGCGIVRIFGSKEVGDGEPILPR